MKKQPILYITATVTFALTLLLWGMMMELIPGFFGRGSDYTLLGMIFPVVPFFCLQLALCGSRHAWFKWVPGCVLLGVAMLCFIEFAMAAGWDSFGWLICLVLCIAPVAGCAMGLIVHGIARLRAR